MGILETGLSKEAMNLHRALLSLQEELEAIDNYHQRADVTADETLKAILVHNRNDEMEHAMMLLEWIRRALPEFDPQMRKFLFSTAEITSLAAGTKPKPAGGLDIGNLS